MEEKKSKKEKTKVETTEKYEAEKKEEKKVEKIEENKTQLPHKPLKINEALDKLRKEKKRKFEQSVDLIINLRDFDVKKYSVNLFVNLKNKVKIIKIGAFLEKKSNLVDTITKLEFGKFKEKKEMKKLLKNYDFFIANAKLMPLIATNFGRVLGPAGKMPNPQLGIITDESEKSIKDVLSKTEKVIRVKTKEPSIKLTIGKENMKNEEIEENIKTVYKAILNALPKNKENIKNIMIKLTMTKPIKIEIK